MDPVRLAVLGHAAADRVDVVQLAEQLDVPQRRVAQAYGRLREFGIIDDTGRLDQAALREMAASLPQLEPVDEGIMDGEWSDEEATILARFFSGSRLTSIPTQRAKRLVVLERLAQEFEPGMRYPERQVNFMLQLFHQDYAALRRYLVDEGYLTRADGVYWRTGGRYDITT